MIKYIEGDIFSTPAQVIVNAVNTVGVMGKGIALEFKQRYPKMFETYKKMCEKHQLTVGKLALVYEPDHWILLFPTKQNWRYPSKIEYIESGLIRFSQTYMEKNISSIAFPKLGCGNGELVWDDVKQLMEKYLKPLPIDIYIYLKPYKDIPEHKATASTAEWLRNNAKDMSYNGVKEDIVYQSSMLPIQFVMDEGKWCAQFKENLTFQDEDSAHQETLMDEEAYRIWDKARLTNICVAESLKERLFYELLLSLGYVSKVKLIEQDRIRNAYQLNNGMGRVFPLKEKL